MKKLSVLLITALAAIAPCAAQSAPASSDCGEIRIITDFHTDKVHLVALPPQLFDVEVNAMFSSPYSIRVAEVADGRVATFGTEAYPALYSYDEATDDHFGIDFMAMPGDTICIDFTSRTDGFPKVTGPKVTVDFAMMLKSMRALGQELAAAQRAKGATAADSVAARAAYDAGLKQLFLANTDNAGAVSVLMRMDRKEWDELLPMIPEEEYQHPCVAPTYCFMRRCVSYGLMVKPAEILPLDE